MATICLCMIVRDEAAVIARCLESVRGLIDHWVVCDTGSTDGTQGIVAASLAGIPGELHQRPWVDFGHNRTEAIRLARDKADYILVLDADMVVNVHEGMDRTLTADAYAVKYEVDLGYRQLMLVSSRHDWRYIGATHEYVHAATACDQRPIDWLTLTHHCDGSGRTAKFERDVALLSDAVARDPDDNRSIFYLAQSYRDLGRAEEALNWYQRRAAGGGWAEEVFYSLYQIGALRQKLGHEWSCVLSSLTAAYDYDPRRIEPIYMLVHQLRLEGRYALGHLLSGGCLGAACPDGLFVERNVYRYRLAFEHAICCHYVGRFADAVRINDGLLALADLPAEYRAATARNRALSAAAGAGHAFCAA